MSGIFQPLKKSLYDNFGKNFRTHKLDEETIQVKFFTDDVSEKKLKKIAQAEGVELNFFVGSKAIFLRNGSSST